MDDETQRVLADYSREITRLSAKVDALQRGTRTPQLAYSSLEEGQAVEVRAGDGTTRQRIGWQPDGSVAVVTEGGDPVSAPSAPTVTPSIAGLKVTWDGTLADPDAALPADFDHMAVHVSDSSGFTPSAATYQGTIRRAGEGGTLPVAPLPYVVHYVVLIPVTTGGVQGTPSAEASGTPVQVDGPDLTAGSVTAGIIAAGAVTADKLEAILVLATQIVAGTLGAARVEVDSGGIRGYNASDALIFAIDTSTGSATFTGDITGSTISGGSITAQATSDPESRIELIAGSVDSVIQLWPPDHVTYDWRPAGFQSINYGARPVLRTTAPYELGRPYASIEMSGYSAGSTYTQIAHYANWHRFEADPGSFDPAQVYLHPEVPLWADFHEPVTQDMLAEPDFATSGSFVDFDPADFPTIAFNTGPSGRATVKIAMSGNNDNSANSSIALGFRLSGGSTVAASLKHCAFGRSIAAADAHTTQAFLEVPLQLTANSSYTLTPAYRISSGNATTSHFDLALPNFISVTPTM